MTWTCSQCCYMNDGPICTHCRTPRRNPPQPVQDRAEDLLSTWKSHGHVMFPQQRLIYHKIAENMSVNPDIATILEAGCGNGVGSAVIWNRRVGAEFRATDSLQSNVDFARCLYPWIDFQVWDICKPYGLAYDAVVCVECLEHVADPQRAMQHLLNAARQDVWISTPNGAGKPQPPSNPFHVAEFSPLEMRGMIQGCRGVKKWEILGWEDFKQLDEDTRIDPLVYHIFKEQTL